MKTKTATHTPTPWKAIFQHVADKNGNYIYSPPSGRCLGNGEPVPTDLANAEIVVKAVNAYEPTKKAIINAWAKYGHIKECAEVLKWISKALVLAAIVVTGLTGAAAAGQPMTQFDQMMAVGKMMAHADRALIIAETPLITLRYDESPRLIEEVADKLRARGFRLDEEAMLLNPDIIHIVGRKRS